MALKRNDMPLSSFDSRYHDLIIAGAKERIEVRQTSKKDAARLRNLLCTYRARVRAAYLGKDDAQWEPLYGAIIGVSDDGMSCVIRPRDQEAAHLLSDIRIGGDERLDIDGIKGRADLPSLPSDPLAEFDSKED